MAYDPVLATVDVDSMRVAIRWPVLGVFKDAVFDDAVVSAAAFAIGACFAALNGGLRLSALGGSPVTILIGGSIIAFYLLSITILAPQIGVGTAVFLVLLGQIVSAAAIDHFGLLGAAQTPVSGARLLGIALMIVGVVLARKPI